MTTTGKLLFVLDPKDAFGLWERMAEDDPLRDRLAALIAGANFLAGSVRVEYTEPPSRRVRTVTVPVQAFVRPNWDKLFDFIPAGAKWKRVA